MKHFSVLFPWIAIVANVLASCQNIDVTPSPYSDTAIISTADFNVTEFIKNPRIVVAEESNNVSIRPKAPFATCISESDSYEANYLGRITNGAITLSLKDIPLSAGKEYTRDIILYVHQAEKRNVEGFGQFAYPVRVKQRGSDGTIRLTAEEVSRMRTSPTSILASMPGLDGQRYVKGTVKSISPVTQRTMAPGTTGNWTLPWIIEGAHFVKDTIDTMEMVITAEDEDLPVRIEYLAKYRLFDNFTVMVGDNVEICIREAGVGKVYDQETGIWILAANPLDVYVL